MKSQIERGKLRFSLLLCLGLSILFAVQTFGPRPILSPVAAAQASDGAGSLFRTNNGGGNWTAGNSGLSSDFITSLVVDPLSPNNIYAGGSRGIFKSTDGGNNWFTPNGDITLSIVQALAIDPVTPSNIYAVTSERGAYKSADGGFNWTRINNGLGSDKILKTLIINPANPSILYLGTEQSIFKSTDGGASWNSVLKLPGTGDISFAQDLALDPADPSIVYVIGSNRIFKSTDGGGKWNELSITGISPQEIALAPTNPTTIYIRSLIGAGDFFKSTDGGDNFTKIAQNTTALNNLFIYELVVDPVTPSTLYAASVGVFKSTDGGSNWVDTGLSVGNVFGLAIDPRNPSNLYAGTSGGTQATDSPWITGVSLDGKKLIVSGRNFDNGAVILLDGERQKTDNDEQSPANKLISKKAGKKVKRNPEVKLQIRNASGQLSQQLTVSQSLD